MRTRVNLAKWESNKGEKVYVFSSPMQRFNFFLVYGVEEDKQQQDIIGISCKAAIKLLELFCPNAKDITEVYKYQADFFHASVNNSLYVTKNNFGLAEMDEEG